MPSITLTTLNTAMTANIQATETDLYNTLANVGENTSTADMLRIQADVQKWTMMVDIQSTVGKNLSDTLKGIIQKS